MRISSGSMGLFRGGGSSDLVVLSYASMKEAHPETLAEDAKEVMVVGSYKEEGSAYLNLDRAKRQTKTTLARMVNSVYKTR